MTKLQICIHEAGHAVALKWVLGRVPQKIVVRDELNAGEIHAPMGQPAGTERTAFAAYDMAGRDAVAEAVSRGLLSGVDPNYRYSFPAGPANDESKIKSIHGVEMDVASRWSKEAVTTNWGAVWEIAQQLLVSNLLDEAALAYLLSNVPRAR